MSGVIGPLKLSIREREILVAKGIPWAIETGRSSHDLMCIFYEEHLDRPLVDVQEEFRIIPCDLDMYSRR